MAASAKQTKSTKPKIEKITGLLSEERVLAESSNASRELYQTARYGSVLSDGRLQLSLIEAHYLQEKGRLDVVDGRGKLLSTAALLKRASRKEKNFWTRYCVFRDFRNRGYIIKTALKFGADFRVYERGIKPGEDHAKWIVYPVRETDVMTWHAFAAKNRVAHSTKKKLIVGVVDEENDVSYWEIHWVRP